jgi:hypothetical protein
MVRARGIEPRPQAWEAHVLPIYYARKGYFIVFFLICVSKGIFQFWFAFALSSSNLIDLVALEDIIPLDAFFGKEPEHGQPPRKKKKKIDREALSSPIMRIPRMDILVARDLIDIGMKELYQLQGRSAESLFEEIRKLREETPAYRLAYLRMAIYYSENDPADQKLLHPQEWQDA